MVLEGDDWLALTKESTLEPEIPICDPHHHFWEYRPEPPAYHRYLLEELAEDINSGHNVRSTVFIEVSSNYRTGGPEAMRPVGEVEFVEALAPFVTYSIEKFGPDRCMFESNFPVDKVSLSYHVLYNAFKRVSQGYTASERANLFHDTAARVYRLNE